MGVSQSASRRSDALVLIAEAYLRDTKVAASTDDRYQVIVHVDSKDNVIDSIATMGSYG